MVLGMAGIFGGNAIDKGASTPAAAAQTAQNTTKPSTSPGASTFGPILKSVIQGTTASQRAAIIAKTVATTDGNSSITLVPGLPPVTVPTTPPATTSTTTTPTTTTTPVQTSTPTTTPAASGSDPTSGGSGSQLSSAIDILTAQLQADGVDTSQIQMVEQDTLVTVPGAASYENNQIVINVNGRTHSYSSDLTMAYPQVTANLIQQFIAGYDV